MGELEEIMARYAGGDDAQLAALYDAAAPALFPFLTKLCRDRVLAEDLTHETFLRIHASRGTYRRGARVLPWMFTIGRRLFLDSLRSRRREGPSLDADDDDARAPDVASTEIAADEAMIGARLAARIEEILAGMPETQATAFRLLKQESLSIAEAAAVLGTTEMTVKLRAHRAYESLRRVIGSEWELEGTSVAARAVAG